MAKKTFDLGTTLAEALGKVSESGTFEQIEYLPLADLVADERNFYNMDGIDELAANIETIGLQQPLRVMPDPANAGKYLIISGHRRRAALELLGRETAPCIVERSAGSPELQELRLIMANSDSRRISSADLAKQAERVEMLLYELKEQGFEFPGRMRDHVAEACKVSKTKLATLKVIREKLIPVWRPYWESGELAEAAAYAVAQQTPENQAKIFSLHRDPKHAYEWSVKERAEKIKKCEARTCELTEDGKCSFADKALAIEFLGKGYHSCASYGCCKGCYNFETCRQVCPLVKDKQAKMTEEKKEAQKAAKAAEKARDAQLADCARTVWARYGELRKAKGLDTKAAHEAQGHTIYQWRNYDDEAKLEDGSADFKPSQDMPWGYSRAEDVNRIVKCADVLGCSVDYLLGRTGEREPWSKTPWISCDEKDPPEGSFVFACTRDGVVVPSVYFRARFMDFTERSVGNVEIKRVQYWLPLPAMPEGKKWQGQETLERLLKGDR